MSHASRAHLQRLMTLNRAHLRELEVQQAKFGLLHVPSHITVQIAEYQHQITHLEEQMSVLMPMHNLPPRDYEQFVGRQRELAEVRRLLGPRSRAFVLTIDGIGGIGKSALALEAAYSLCNAYASLPEVERFDALVWVSAKRSYLTADGILERRQVFRTLDDLYAAIAQVLDFPAITRARAEDQRTIVEQVLSEQRTLLILDNLETVDDEELLVFLRELPEPTKALVTTRHRIDVAHPVRLMGMPHTDALILSAQEATRKGVTLTPDEHEQLWQRTGGVPLALVWSIGLMGLGGSVESVLRRLGSGQSDIARFCFAESIAQIRGGDAYWLLLALALFASDASREALGVVAGLGEDHFGRDVGLEALLRLSLVNKDGDRFSLLPLTKSFVQDEVKVHGPRMQAARHQWAAYYGEVIDTYSGWSDDWRGHDRIETELANILLMFDYLYSTMEYEETTEKKRIITAQSIPQARNFTRMSDRVSRTLRIRGYWHECERIVSLALSLAKASQQHVSVGWSTYTLARIAYYRGDLGRTRHLAEEILAIAELNAQITMEIRAKLVLGMLALQEDRLEEAKLLLDAALEAAYVGDSTQGLSSTLGAKGDLALRSNDVHGAAEYYQQAIDIARQINDLPKLAWHLMRLSVASRCSGNLAAAHDQLAASLQSARECGWVSVLASALYERALVQAESRLLDEARSSTLQALDLFRRLGMKREQAKAEALLQQLGTQQAT